MFLNLGQYGGDAQDDTEKHVESDEEFVQLALADVLARVVRIRQDDGGESANVKEDGVVFKGEPPARGSLHVGAHES